MHWADRVLAVYACLIARQSAPANAPGRPADLPACLPARLPACLRPACLAGSLHNFTTRGFVGLSGMVNIYSTEVLHQQARSPVICALALPSQLHALLALVQRAAAAGLVNRDLHSGRQQRRRSQRPPMPPPPGARVATAAPTHTLGRQGAQGNRRLSSSQATSTHLAPAGHAGHLNRGKGGHSSANAHLMSVGRGWSQLSRSGQVAETLRQHVTVPRRTCFSRCKPCLPSGCPRPRPYPCPEEDWKWARQHRMHTPWGGQGPRAHT